MIPCITWFLIYIIEHSHDSLISSQIYLLWPPSKPLIICPSYNNSVTVHWARYQFEIKLFLIFFEGFLERKTVHFAYPEWELGHVLLITELLWRLHCEVCGEVRVWSLHKQMDDRNYTRNFASTMNCSTKVLRMQLLNKYSLRGHSKLRNANF